jgi:hypothetical protein
MMRPPYFSNSTMSSVTSEDSLSSILSGSLAPSSNTSVTDGGVQITRWIIDTRAIWQGEHIKDVVRDIVCVAVELDLPQLASHPF